MKDIDSAIIRLLKNCPFYGELMIQLKRKLSREVPVAGVMAKGANIWLLVNPEGFAKYKPKERSAILEHEALHVLNLHFARRNERGTHIWGIACDIAINQLIEGLPQDVLFPERFNLKPKLSAEEYYDLLHKNRELIAGIFDQHAIWMDSDISQELAENIVREIVRKTINRVQGNMPGEVEELVKEYTKPSSIPWKQILARFIASSTKTMKSATWKRPNRRFSCIPGFRRKWKLNMIIAVDTSASISDDNLREFSDEILKIAHSGNSEITVIECDAAIHKVYKFKNKVESFKGRGGTDFRPVFEYAQRQRPKPDCLIYLTDGYGDAPDTAPPFPTLWVLTGSGKNPASWGKELRLK